VRADKPTKAIGHAARHVRADHPIDRDHLMTIKTWRTLFRSAARQRRHCCGRGWFTMAASATWLATLPAWAAAGVLAGWDVHSLPGGANNFGASPLAASSSDANLSVGGLTRGAGVGTTGTAAARGWGGNDWTAASAAAAATADDSLSWTMSARPGFQLSISAISRIDYRRSSTGATGGVLQARVGSAPYADVANLAYPSTASGGASVAAVDLSGVVSLQNLPAGSVVTLRLVNFGGTASGGTWYLFDTANSAAADLEVSGSVTTAGPPVDGQCGSSAGQSFIDAPGLALCSAGSASAVLGNGPWSWTCTGTGGGIAASCSANRSAIGVCF
jgi:hypothetical protein